MDQATDEYRDLYHRALLQSADGKSTLQPLPVDRYLVSAGLSGTRKMQTKLPGMPKSVANALAQFASERTRKSDPKSVLGPTARCMTRLQGGVFKSSTAAKQCWQGF